MNEFIRNFLNNNFAVGILTGLISGLLVTIYYRHKDLKKEKLLYCQTLCSHAIYLVTLSEAYNLLTLSSDELKKIIIDIHLHFPCRNKWIEIPLELKSTVTNVENECSEFTSILLKCVNTPEQIDTYSQQYKDLCKKLNKNTNKLIDFIWKFRSH